MNPSRLGYKMPRSHEMPVVEHIIDEMPITPWKILRTLGRRKPGNA